MTTLLTAAAREVLTHVHYAANVQRLFLTRDNLPDQVYREVKEVCTRLGGRWNTASQAFLFPSDPMPALKIVCASGEMPPRNPYAFFQTPASISEDLIRHGLNLFGCIHCDGYRHDQPLHACAYIPRQLRILEPSAGQGAIARRVRDVYAILGRDDAILHCCELHPVNRALLRQQRFEVVAEDFLSYHLAPGTPPYDLILMNPPFHTLEYIEHIEHAWSLLQPRDGRLVAVVPTSFLWRTDARSEQFRTFVRRYKLEVPFVYPQGRFKASGTSVETALIALHKQDDTWKSQPFHGSYNWYCAALQDEIAQSQTLSRQRSDLWQQIDQGVLPDEPTHPEWSRTRQVLRRFFAEVIEHAKKDWIEIATDEETLCAMEHAFLAYGVAECQYERHRRAYEDGDEACGVARPRPADDLTRVVSTPQDTPSLPNPLLLVQTRQPVSPSFRPRNYVQQTLFALP